jgi:hypothetical protein
VDIHLHGPVKRLLVEIGSLVTCTSDDHRGNGWAKPPTPGCDAGEEGMVSKITV